MILYGSLECDIMKCCYPANLLCVLLSFERIAHQAAQTVLLTNCNLQKGLVFQFLSVLPTMGNGDRQLLCKIMKQKLYDDAYVKRSFNNRNIVN